MTYKNAFRYKEGVWDSENDLHDPRNVLPRRLAEAIETVIAEYENMYSTFVDGIVISDGQGDELHIDFIEDESKPAIPTSDAWAALDWQATSVPAPHPFPFECKKYDSEEWNPLIAYEMNPYLLEAMDSNPTGIAFGISYMFRRTVAA